MNSDRKPEIIVFAGPNGSGKIRKAELFFWESEYWDKDAISKLVGKRL